MSWMLLCHEDQVFKGMIAVAEPVEQCAVVPRWAAKAEAELKTTQALTHQPSSAVPTHQTGVPQAACPPSSQLQPMLTWYVGTAKCSAGSADEGMHQ